MRKTDSLVRTSRHKKKKCRSPSVASADDVVATDSDCDQPNDVERKRGHSSSSNSSPERVKKHKKKKKKHRHKHKQNESDEEEEEEVDDDVIDLSPEPTEEPVRHQKSQFIETLDHEDDERPFKRPEKQRIVRESSVEFEGEVNRRKDKRRVIDVEGYEPVRVKQEPGIGGDERSRHAQSSSRHRSGDGRQRDRPESSDHASRRYHRREPDRPRERERPREAERPREDRSRETDRSRDDRPRDGDRQRQHDRDHSASRRHDDSARPRHEPRERRGSEERSRQQPDERPQRGRGGRGGRGGAHGNRGRRNEPEETFEWGRKADNVKEEPIPPGEKEKPNFAPSGKLTEEANSFNGVVIKYSEPPEARKPRRRWRFYPFKGEKALQTLYIHRQSSYLIGRDRKIADIPVDHPSCSKQHAALQYRLVPFDRENGTTGKRVRPYIIDLESANGTFVNNNKIDCKKYVELLERDVVKFGFSSREYVLLHEHSKDDDYDDVGELDESGEVAADA